MPSIHLNSVIRLLQRKGNDDFSLIINSQSAPTNDIDDVVITPTSDNVQSYRGKYSKREIDGTTIKASDIKLYVDPSTCTAGPKTSDKMTDGTNEFTIQDVEPFYDQDTIALYILQLRR